MTAGVATFAAPPTFLGIDRTDPASPICVAGIPFDLGTTNRVGARFGPTAIRQASRMLIDGEHPVHWVDPSALPLADIGNFAIALGDLAKSLTEIEVQATGVKHLVALCCGLKEKWPARLDPSGCSCGYLAGELRTEVCPRVGLLSRNRRRIGTAGSDGSGRHPISRRA